MASPEPSMEDILASIKRVIAEEKELRSALDVADQSRGALEDDADAREEEDVLELDEPIAPPPDPGPPLVDDSIAKTTRHSLEELSSVAAALPQAPPANPLEEVVREMLRPILKEWLNEHLPAIVNDHVKREISRITGRKV